jgi:hypothetical protein
MRPGVAKKGPLVGAIVLVSIGCPSPQECTLYKRVRQGLLGQVVDPPHVGFVDHLIGDT